MRSKRSIVVWACAGGLSALIGIGVVLIFWMTQTEQLPAVAPDETIVYSTDEPSETKPVAETYNWRGRPDDPKYISLKTLRIEGFIQRVGVDQEGRIAVPNNIYVSGWFVDSVRPGDVGLSILDGHVNGRRTSEGLFASIGQLRPGDRYTITFGNESTREFEVQRVVTVSVDEAAKLLFVRDTRYTSQVNLITCAGHYSDQLATFTDRVIVTSSLVES